MKKLLLSFVAIATLLSFRTLTFAQSPSLGSAANFALFTASGAVGNTGTSHVTGHVGSNGGSTTGFGNVDGVMHNNDAATNKASADLLLAANQIDATTSNFFRAPLLGNGDTLVAGVYEIPGVTTLNGNLYFDAKGNSNAVFIIKVQAAFFSNANAKVNLINGALACNVFWKVEGVVSLGSGTFMRGNIIANNAAINLNTNDTLEGRALSTSGALAVTNVMIYTPLGCSTAPLTGPTAPNLLSTFNYGIFSGNGSVANSGTSYVNGDVGTNVGLTTGFNPQFVSGTIHPQPDGSTAAAASDLLTVYNSLNTQAHDIELLYPAQFGNNLVLTPHTYLLSAATNFTGTVFLNAQGNPNAVFIIKINGALTTGTYSKVALMNGAQAKNVYWKVDGAVQISDYSVFNGTIVANNGAIDLNTGTTLVGRALTTNGALSTASIDAAIPGTSLPVKWLYFRGAPTQKAVLLEWATTEETNNGFFTIERSKEGQSFETLTRVTAQGSSGRKDRNYTFTDVFPYTSAYYRISQTDKDGQTKYFNTIQVKMSVNTTEKTIVYLRESFIHVQTSGVIAGNGSIEVHTIEGKKISSQKIILTKDTNSFKVEKPTQQGVYILIVISNGQKIHSGKVMVL